MHKRSLAFDFPTLNLDNPFHIQPDESEPDSSAMRHFVFKGLLGIGALNGIPARKTDSQSGLCEFFDTWTWSLWSKNAVLANEDGWVLQQGGETFRAAAGREIPKFAEDFPEGSLRERLRDVTDIRALRKTASVRLEREVHEYQDGSGKPLVRLSLCRIAPARSKRVRTTLVEIRPARGGRLLAGKLAAALISAGCRAKHENLVQESYKLCKVRPAPYSVKLRPAFAPETHARTVLLEIFGTLLSLARWNEVGIIQDIDTEFLHDYRVALRKLRSVTGQMKGVFPEKLAASWKQKIGVLCRETNTLRDHDVHLLSRRRLENMLPPDLRGGLDIFFEELKTGRETEAKRVADFLRSDDYKNRVTSLQREWTSLPAMEDNPNSARPIREVAGERILKRFRRIRKTGKSITPETPDSDIHSLRIDCKKMRYLLECFGHLFPLGTVDPLARKLSKLQNLLGRYNDTSLQQEYLLRQAAKHVETGNAGLCLSLGALIGALRQEHAALRTRLLSTLDRFTSGTNAQRVSSLGREHEK